MSRKKRFSKHYQPQATPDQLGLLMELHRQAKELSVVIQFLCTSTTGNQSVTYQGNAYTQADVLNLYQDLGSALRDAKKTLHRCRLPRWNDLNATSKLAIKLACLAENPDAAFLTINLGRRFADQALKNKRGLALRNGDIIRVALMDLGLPGSLALTVELSENRERNSPLHIHGIALIPEQQLAALSHQLKERLTADYIEHAGNKAVLIKPVQAAGPLTGYICKDIMKDMPMNNRRFYASKDLTEPSRLFYEELRQWYKSLPELIAELPETKPKPPAQSGKPTKFQQMIKEKQIQMKDRKRQARQEEARLKQARKLLREQPTPDDQYNQQHLLKALDTVMQSAQEAA